MNAALAYTAAELAMCDGVFAAIDQAGTPTVNAGLEVDRGSQANTYLLWNETTDKWTFTNDGVAYDDIGAASTASYANSAFIAANTASATAALSFNHANAGFDVANTALTNSLLAITSDANANAASNVANASFAQANLAFNHANSAFVRANNSVDANAGGTITANVVIDANLQSANVHSNTYIRFSNTSLVTYTSTNTANGQIEFFNNSLFGTVDTTQGRGYVPVVQFRYLESNSTYDISTSELPFMGNANGVILTTNSAYEIEWDVYFLKTTAGTVTFSLRFGAAPQIVNAGYIGGRANTSGPANTAGRIVGTADPVALPATPTLGSNTLNYFNIKAFIISNASTSGNCYLSAVTSAGTITPNVGSYIKVTRLPRPNTGLWS